MANLLWKVQKDENSSKAWIMDAEDNRLSSSMSQTAANDLCLAHNIAVGFLEAYKGIDLSCIPREQITAGPETQPCEECATPFQPRNQYQRFCKEPCRRAWHKANRK